MADTSRLSLVALLIVVGSAFVVLVSLWTLVAWLWRTLA